MDTTASLIAIVDLAFKVIKYVDDVREGGKERSELHQRVITVYDLLWNLKNDFESHNLDEESTWSKPVKPLFNPGGTIDQLKLVLEEIASKLVLPSRDFKSTIKKLKWPFNKPEVQRILDRLRSLTDSISIAFGRANLHVGIDTNKDVKFLRQASESAELETALKWISPLDFRVLQKAAQRRPLSGTCSWFLDNPQVRGWSQGRTKALWCYGIPGAGKTVLATALFQTLLERHAHDNVAVLIAYCSFDDALTHSSYNIVSSFLRQLLEKHGQMSDTIRELYTEHKEDREESRLSQERLTAVMSKELESFDRTFIIIDGLDELHENKQKVELLQTIESLDPLPQLLVTSRPVETISKWFAEFAKKDRYRTRTDFTEVEYSYHYCGAYDERDEGKDSQESDNGDYSDTNTTNSEEQLDSDDEETDRDWTSAASYHCTNCGSDACITCYGQFDICLDCNQPKDCLKWAWPGTVLITARSDDLKQYILWRINNSDNLRALLENSRAKVNGLSDTIVQRVEKESHKMFLLAKFHMDSLEQQATARDLIKTLETLPSNINDIYSSVLNRISSKRLAFMLEKLLIIVATAKRLLSTEALAHAITIEHGDDDIDELALPDVRYLASMCAGLIVIDPSGSIRLSHETIGSYIEKTGIKHFKSGHVVLAELCLIYLNFSAFSSGACDGPERDMMIQARQFKYPFFRYATTHWGIHAQLAHDHVSLLPEASIIDQLTENLMSKPRNIASATQFMWLDDIEESSGWDVEEHVHGLHLAAYFGLSRTIANLLATGANADVQDGLQTTPLMYAAQAGHTNIVQLLLASGADPGRVCRRGRTALYRACERRHTAAVGEIVSSPRDIAVNAVDGSSFNVSALLWAVSTDNSEIVKHLLTRKDIDVNQKLAGHRGINVLHRSALGGQVDVMRLLLSDERVAIDSGDDSQHTALMMAAIRGYDKIVALLLEKGANVEARDVCGNRPLLIAIICGSLECVRLLIQHGADYKFKDNLGGGILHGCAGESDAPMMRYLLENLPDLDTNTQDSRSDTPLHIAVKCHKEAIVRVLLEYGARTDIKNLHGMTPLRLARDQGLDGLLDLLTKARLKEIEASELAPHGTKGAGGEIDLPKRRRRADTLTADYKISIETAVQKLSKNDLEEYINDMGPNALEIINDPSRELLHIVVGEGRCDNLCVLLDRGADIESKNTLGRTPLHTSVQLGEYEAAELLLDRGSNIDARDLSNHTPLEFCVDEELMHAFAFLLLERGASFEKSACHRLLPQLGDAVKSGDFNVVKILVEGGLPFRKYLGGRSLYQMAKKAGHDHIAQYLYEQEQKDRTESHDSEEGKITDSPEVEADTAERGPKEGIAESLHEAETRTHGAKEDQVKKSEHNRYDDIVTKSGERSDEKSTNLPLGMTQREIGLLSIIILLSTLLLFK
ncbi:hypothetical protein O1611_g8235 [Lasiodiplodia mahajangana]|uniref:Uncharacterized protein n=1 Tax=Lasiodiplodia mahajangana TaxID=1108764 RepID=A0ACC2JD46_9PEZI|nr:hypothetical protein O1611_g8235 [Lasiodiplodia mahajangana]